MADYGDRRDYRNGGGYGGDRKRKRGRDEDDEDHPPRRQRQRTEFPAGTRIKRGLLELGDDVESNMAPRSVRSFAEQIGKICAEHWEKDAFVKDVLFVTASKMAIEQPLKIPYVAATVLFANAELDLVGEEFLARLAPQLQDAINAGRWRDFKLLLRLLTCLSPMFAQDGIMALLDELFSRAVDLQTASQDDVVGIELVKIILLTLPYLVAYSNDPAMPQRATELLEKTGIVASSEHPLDPLVDPYLSDNDTRPMPCTSLIRMLQQQLQAEASSGWKLDCIPRTYSASESNGGSNGTTEYQHTFPTLDVPSPIIAGPTMLFPELYFSMYAGAEIETVPALENIAASLIRDAVVDTLNILDYNRNAAARILTEVDNFWMSGKFVKRGLAFDRVKDMHGTGSTWKPEDVVIDAIFSQMFRLPSAEHKQVYYHALITELCRLSPGAVAPSLGRAIRFLYRNIDAMDLELSYRFLDWFAHHLSNFEFKWRWTEWIPDLDEPVIDPKRVFIESAIDKEIRLSFSKRIREGLPSEFAFLIPESRDRDIPEFKYKHDDVPFAAEGQQLLGLLKSKADDAEIQKVFDKIESESTAGPLVAATNVYMTAICSVGSKSLSHVLSTIDRCKERLISVGRQSEEARREIITAVVEFWQEHPGNAVNIVDKLLNYSIITPMSVVEWALRDRMDRGRALASAQMYELVATTINKVTDRLRQIVQQRNNMAVPFEQRQQIDEVLPRERQAMADLFTTIDDAVQAVATGANDEMIERYDGDNAEQQLLIIWGRRWARVWRRKAAVEETIVGEAAVGPLIEPTLLEEEGEDEQELNMDAADEVL